MKKQITYLMTALLATMIVSNRGAKQGCNGSKGKSCLAVLQG